MSGERQIRRHSAWERVRRDWHEMVHDRLVCAGYGAGVGSADNCAGCDIARHLVGASLERPACLNIPDEHLGEAMLIAEEVLAGLRPLPKR